MNQGLKDNLCDIGLLWLRVLMGLGIAYHGYGKIFGGGLEGFAQGVAGMGLPFPELMAWAAALSEFAGGILVAAGLFGRIAAFFVFATMTVAVFVAHAADPFNVKELALAYWTMSGAVILLGTGRFSLDRMLCKSCCH